MPNTVRESRGISFLKLSVNPDVDYVFITLHANEATKHGAVFSRVCQCSVLCYS